MHHYGHRDEAKPRQVQVLLADPQADFPRKAHQDDAKSGVVDVGYDLVLIARENNESGDQVGKVTVFDTGVAMLPENGTYIEIVARSSLYKSGYMMANGVGIIDPSYTGTIKIPLLKFSEGKNLDLPFRAVQAIPRTIAPVELSRAASLPPTARGGGGFGSTGGFYPGQGRTSLRSTGLHHPSSALNAPAHGQSNFL